jgi:hypothetical protein
MTIAVSGSNITFNDNSVQNTAATGFGFKSRIINGAMVIDQRNAGAASANTIDGYFLDRWIVQQWTVGKLVAQQNAGSVTPPLGFINYLGVTSQSAYTVTGSDRYTIQQPIEGLNVSDLGWGTANAQTVTISFWVRSSLTGSFSGALTNSAVNRSYPFSYTISSANTWEQKSVTIAGDTTGTWLATNGIGIRVYFNLGSVSSVLGTAGSWSGSSLYGVTGTTSVVGTNGATFYITGVQLEKGSTATSFDYRPYGTELQLAQRYYEVVNARSNFTYHNASIACASFQFRVTKRTSPTITTTADTSITTTSAGVDGVFYEKTYDGAGAVYSLTATSEL